VTTERDTWIQHSRYLALFTSFFHLLQFAASTALWFRTNSPALLTFGLDAAVSAAAALVLAFRILREWRNRYVAAGYIAAAAAALYLGGSMLWRGNRPDPSILGIALAAVSMLVIPIIGSYMKVLAVELRSQALKSAAVFTFGNSYLSMVLLTSLLLNSGMGFAWGDPLGALVMFPFMAQKGIQILLEEGKHEYVED
jgi:divalent metal cation (Fe/Co/Zn/Cd) transporter